MLAQTLQALEGDGFVVRKAYDEMPLRVEYRLSPLGVEIAKQVESLANWIEGNLPRIAKQQLRLARGPAARDDGQCSSVDSSTLCGKIRRATLHETTMLDLFDKHRVPLRRLDGQTAVVTGGSQGMGKEIARELARLGARVVIVARDGGRTRAAIADIEATTGKQSVTFIQADLSSLAAVRAAAAEFRENHPVLDILVNNAGGHFLRRFESPDGIERSWAINFVAPFLLTNLLLDRVLASEAARIVNVASNAMSKTLTMADLKRDNRFDSWRAYGEAKLSLVMFTYGLARRLAGARVTVNCLHPGLVATSVADSAKPEWMPTVVLDFVKLFLLTPEKGARSALALAAAPELDSITGRHFTRGRESRSVPISYDAGEQQRAWSLGERLTGFSWGDR